MPHVAQLASVSVCRLINAIDAIDVLRFLFFLRASFSSRLDVRASTRYKVPKGLVGLAFERYDIVFRGPGVPVPGNVDFMRLRRFPKAVFFPGSAQLCLPNPMVQLLFLA